MSEKNKNILMLTFIAVCIVALCLFFISQNSSKTLLYGENGGSVPKTEAVDTHEDTVDGTVSDTADLVS